MPHSALAILFCLPLAIILGVCRLAGWGARKIGQLQVIGKMIAGVLTVSSPSSPVRNGLVKGMGESGCSRREQGDNDDRFQSTPLDFFVALHADCLIPPLPGHLRSSMVEPL